MLDLVVIFLIYGFIVDHILERMANRWQCSEGHAILMDVIALRTISK